LPECSLPVKGYFEKKLTTEILLYSRIPRGGSPIGFLHYPLRAFLLIGYSLDPNFMTISGPVYSSEVKWPL
jgi:hypothetical protein